MAAWLAPPAPSVFAWGIEPRPVPMKIAALYRQRLKSWSVPMGYASGAILVGLLLPRLETRFLPDFVHPASVQATIAVCSSVASGMIALTGIVFSLIFVMVQFSASAYSPRLVLWVARDPVMPHSLGMFTATFLYALTLLAWVDRGGSGRVPYFSTCALVILVLSSMGMFVALIERIGSLQVNRMLIFTGDHGRKAIASLYESLESPATTCDPEEYRRLPVVQTLSHLGRPQVIQAFDAAALVRMATECGAVVQLQAAVGDTVLEMTPLFVVHGERPMDEQKLKSTLALGDERTFEQDPKYALRIVVDIAIKALSPAINDPTTAVQALDQIEDLLLRLGRSQLEYGAFRDAQGNLRLVAPFPSWEDFLRLALDEIRAYGADSVQVMRRMKALTNNLMVVLPPERHDALRHWEKRLQSSIARSFDDAEEKRDASVADRQGLGIGEQGAPGPA
jgi:uncharacterized membrane protein